MKKLLLVFTLSLLSVVSFAKSGFPVSLKASYFGQDQWIKTEGLPPLTGFIARYPSTYQFDGVTAPTAGTTSSPGSLSSNIALSNTARPPFTKKFYVYGARAWASEALNWQITLDGANNVYHGVIGPEGYKIDPFFLHSQNSFGAVLKGRVTPATSSSATGVVATLSGAYFSMSADEEYDAPYTMLIVSDSNSEGTSAEGTTSAWDIFTWGVKKDLATNDTIRIRLIDKSQANTTTLDHENYRANNNLYEFGFQPSIIYWMLGTNNPGKSLSDAQYVSDLTNFINHKKTRYPNSIMIVASGPPNNGSAGTQTALATQRTNAQSIIATANTGIPSTSNQYIEYLPMYDLWDTTDAAQNTANFTSVGSDGNGGIHMNANAHKTKARVRLYNFIKSRNIHKRMKPNK